MVVCISIISAETALTVLFMFPLGLTSQEIPLIYLSNSSSQAPASPAPATSHIFSSSDIPTSDPCGSFGFEEVLSSGFEHP